MSEVDLLKADCVFTKANSIIVSMSLKESQEVLGLVIVPPVPPRQLQSTMLKYCLLIFVCISGNFLFAQKPVIDTSQLGRWPVVSNESLSADGRYARYSIISSNGDCVIFSPLINQGSNPSQQFPQGDFLADNIHAVVRSGS